MDLKCTGMVMVGFGLQSYFGATVCFRDVSYYECVLTCKCPYIDCRVLSLRVVCTEYNLLPCEFCSNTFPSDVLLQHQVAAFFTF